MIITLTVLTQFEIHRSKALQCLVFTTLTTHIEFKNIASKTDERRFISRFSLSGIPHLLQKQDLKFIRPICRKV